MGVSKVELCVRELWMIRETYFNPGVPLGQGDAAAVVQNVPADVVTHWRCACSKRKDHMENVQESARRLYNAENTVECKSGVRENNKVWCVSVCVCAYLNFCVCVCVCVPTWISDVRKFLPFSCPTRLALRTFLARATSLSVTVVHRFILKTEKNDFCLQQNVLQTNKLSNRNPTTF